MNPFDFAPGYRAAGWAGVLWLPLGAKYPPPAGLTGADGYWPSWPDVQTWLDGPPGNIGLRLPDGVIGLDVDAYGDKRGGATIRAAAERYGPLPATWRSSARDDGVSGISLYTVPPGLHWPGEIGPHVEIIQRRHRYMVAPPSVHPSGIPYRWHSPDGSATDSMVPEVGDPAPLPSAWVDAYTAGRPEVEYSKADLNSGEVQSALDGWSDGSTCRQMGDALQRALDSLRDGSRHDAATRGAMRLVRLAVEGHRGARAALDYLGRTFVTMLAAEERRDGRAEWDRILTGAVAMVAGQVVTRADPCTDVGAGIMAPGSVVQSHSLPSPASTQSDDDRMTEADLYALELEREVRRQTMQREARGIVLAAEALSAWTRPPAWSLGALLAEPEQPIMWTVERLLPTGSNVVINAQFKAGKTTLLINLIRALADGKPFLGDFPISDTTDGRIAFWNYEVSAQMMTRWLRRAGIHNVDKVCGLNLRGFGTPLLAPPIMEWAVEELKRNDVRHWLPDPWGRMIVGTDENSNTEVGRWLDVLDTIKERAGVENLILPAHTGRTPQEQGSERARGATRLDDWADVRWLLSVKEETRYFRAHGRDVDVDEGHLTFDPLTGSLTYSEGGRVWEGKGADVEHRILMGLMTQPGQSRNALAKGLGGRREGVLKAVKVLLSQGMIVELEGGLHPGKRVSEWSPEP
jgi:hypothetical protein